MPGMLDFNMGQRVFAQDLRSAHPGAVVSGVVETYQMTIAGAHQHNFWIMGDDGELTGPWQHWEMWPNREESHDTARD